MHAFDRQTDGQAEFSSLDLVCIPRSAVKSDMLWESSSFVQSISPAGMIFFRFFLLVGCFRFNSWLFCVFFACKVSCIQSTYRPISACVCDALWYLSGAICPKYTWGSSHNALVLCILCKYHRKSCSVNKQSVDCEVQLSWLQHSYISIHALKRPINHVKVSDLWWEFISGQVYVWRTACLCSGYDLCCPG